MTNRFRISSTLPRKLEELGLLPDTALRQAGLPMGLFNQDKILVSTQEFFALHRGIAEASNDVGFGLKLGTEERFDRYDPIKIAALSARSFGDAVRSEEHTSELQSRLHLVCRLLLEKKKHTHMSNVSHTATCHID